MSEEQLLDLVKHQNRAIASLRRMMERGYLITFGSDKDQYERPIHTGRWALVKYPTPNDKNSGFAIFESYDDAWRRANEAVWNVCNFLKSGDIIYPLEELPDLGRKCIVKGQ